MGIWKKLKQERIEHYQKHVYGWKERPCTACNGTRYYDNNGSLACGACNGTGKEKYPGPKAYNKSLELTEEGQHISDRPE